MDFVFESGIINAYENARLSMSSTYALQKATINAISPVPVEELLNSWPLLFEPKYLRDHFTSLTGFCACTKMKDQFAERSNVP